LKRYLPWVNEYRANQGFAPLNEKGEVIEDWDEQK